MFKISNGVKIQENVILAPYTTFKIGGPAKYFCEVKTTEDIKEAVLWAKKNNLPYFALGGGSNLLVSDDGFNGLVVKIENCKLKIENSSVKAEAGVSFAKLVAESVNSGLAGLEWAVGIPGTIGGAVCGNAGAYGHSISEIVAEGKAINSNGEIINFDKDFCNFCYRGSIFKEASNLLSDSGNKLVIIEVKLKLAKGDIKESREEMKKIIAERSDKIPPYPSAGSFFKNYKVKKNIREDPLIKKHPELSQKTRGGKIGVGYLLEHCDLKGKIIGGAQISKKHANFIVNIGNAKASDVLELAEFCKEKVKEKYNFELEIEKKLIGFD